MTPKKIAAILIVLALACAGNLAGQQLTLYKVPSLTGFNKASAIASNNLGDILVIYCNTIKGAVYYYKKHGTTTWTGPTAIPGQPSEDLTTLYWTDIAATKDNVFHAIWTPDSHLAVEYGLYYGTFDPASESWSTPQKLIGGRVGEPKLITNTWTDELFLIWDWNLEGKNKDVFYKIKTKSGWGLEVNLSAIVNAPAPGIQANAALAPHGEIAETNAFAAVDEGTGNIYVAWKEDEHVDDILYGDDWELRIHMALLDPTYKLIWHEQVTSGHRGFHMLPSVAALNGTAMMAFAWTTEVTYNYIFFTQSGNKLLYDSKFISNGANWIAIIPVNPWYSYFNHLLTHGDETIFTYVDQFRYLRMMRLKDNTWIDTKPVDLSSNNKLNSYPFDSFSDPSIGILSTWNNNADKPEIVITIYSYPKSGVRGGINITTKSGTERSFFKRIAYNTVMWENSPVNSNRNITVARWGIYRKKKSETAAKYVKVGETTGATPLKFNDAKSVDPKTEYDYWVTAVDDKGNESSVPSK